MDELFRFECDVCADKTDKKCKKFYSIQDDGLKQDWKQFKAVWCNPPYDETAKWMRKAYECEYVLASNAPPSR